MKEISIYKEQSEQTMTSLEIAELTGKQHKHVMEAIRKMEPAWVNIAGSNFRLGSMAASVIELLLGLLRIALSVAPRSVVSS